MGSTFWTSHEMGNMVLFLGMIIVLFIVFFLAFLFQINLSAVIYSLFSVALLVLVGVWILVGIRIIKYFDTQDKTPLP
jgi:hypothetical protein